MSRRGHVLALILVVVACIGAAGAVFFNRYSVDQLARRSAELRTQTLWLARSALAAEVRGRRQVETRYGTATVQAQSGRVTVELAGAQAEVGVDIERYQSPLAGR